MTLTTHEALVKAAQDIMADWERCSMDEVREIVGILQAALSQPAAAPVAAQADDVPLVTRESAREAIGHVSQHNGPGRECEAMRLLVAAAPKPPAQPEGEPVAWENTHWTQGIGETTRLSHRASGEQSKPLHDLSPEALDAANKGANHAR